MSQTIAPQQSATDGIPTREAQYCTFRLGDMLFGVEVLYVQEVLLKQQMTRMPLADETVSGLINLRGQIVTAINLRHRFGLKPLEGKDPMNVVVRTHDAAFSLQVDAIGDVVNVDETAFEAPPETLSGAARDLIQGAYKLENVLLLVLDVEKAASIPTDISN